LERKQEVDRVLRADSNLSAEEMELISGIDRIEA
jgi:hypothetical protein